MDLISATLALVAAVTAWLVQAWFARERAQANSEVDRIAQLVRESHLVTPPVRPNGEQTRVLHIPATAESVGVNPAANPRPTDPVQSLVEGLVNGYHQQALEQAKQQFRFSIVAASVGFIWILVVGWSVSGQAADDYFRLVPGVIIDAVALLFFRQAEQTRERATELYDRLRADNRAATAVALVKDIEDPQVRSVVKAQLALHFAGLAPTAVELPNLLTKAEPAAQVTSASKSSTRTTGPLD